MGVKAVKLLLSTSVAAAVYVGMKEGLLRDGCEWPVAFAIMDGKIAALAVCRVGIRTTGYDALEVVAPQALPLGYEGDDRLCLRRGGWCGDDRDRRGGRQDRWSVSAGGSGVVSNARVVMLIQKRVVFIGILTIWVVGVSQVWRCGNDGDDSISF